jgi:hypothetical protein
MGPGEVVGIIFGGIGIVGAANGFVWKMRSDLNAYIKADDERWKAQKLVCQTNTTMLSRVHESTIRMDEREKLRWETSKLEAQEVLRSNPREPRRNLLVTKLVEGDISPDEAYELLPLLKAAIMDRERTAAALLFLDHLSGVIARFEAQAKMEDSPCRSRSTF